GGEWHCGRQPAASPEDRGTQVDSGKVAVATQEEGQAAGTGEAMASPPVQVCLLSGVPHGIAQAAQRCPVAVGEASGDTGGGGVLASGTSSSHSWAEVAGSVSRASLIVTENW